MKCCPCCGLSKPYEEFPRNKRTKDGWATYCKLCHNAKGRASRQKIGGSRAYHLRRRYGLELADVERLLHEQSWTCAICRAPEPEHVDHDHATGEVRGMLCFSCNGGLGQFKDEPSLLLRAAFYLRHSAVPLSDAG
jgi:hypothetical protein